MATTAKSKKKLVVRSTVIKNKMDRAITVILKKPEITIPTGDFVVDRSRLIEFQECPRAGFYGYGYEGVGLSPLQTSVYLLRGDALHLGTSKLISGMTTTDAIEDALLRFEKRARKGMEIEKGEDNPPDIVEQLRLIEGALWTFNATVLPRLKAEYKVLDIEREEAVSLGSGVTMLARTDALLEHKLDHTLHIWSLKTTKQYDSRKEADGQTDVQGLSEALAVEARIGKKISSIQMCCIVLGKRDIIATDIGKEVVTRSPFAWGYRRVGAGIGQADEYYASQYWDCHEPHITTHTKKPSQCPGGKRHKIGDDFEMFPTDEYPSGIEGWIADIMNGTVAPGPSLLEGTFGDKQDGLVFLPKPYYRQEHDVQSFRRQAYWQAKEIQEGLQKVNYATGVALDNELELDIHFRQHKHHCHYPGDCAFLRLCFPPPAERQQIQSNPLKYGYKLREPNHPAENQTLKRSR